MNPALAAVSLVFAAAWTVLMVGTLIVARHRASGSMPPLLEWLKCGFGIAFGAT